MGEAIIVLLVLLLALRPLRRYWRRWSVQKGPSVSFNYTTYDSPPARENGDDDYVVWVNQGRPQGMGRKLAWNIKVAGISQRKVQADAVGFIEGTSRELEIERDASIEGYPHGLRVYGRWQDSAGTVSRAPLGWVPDDIAKSIATDGEPDIPVVARLRCIFWPRPGMGPGLRMDIWTKRRSRGKP